MSRTPAPTQPVARLLHSRLELAVVVVGSQLVVAGFSGLPFTSVRSMSFISATVALARRWGHVYRVLRIAIRTGTPSTPRPARGRSRTRPFWRDGTLWTWSMSRSK
jgi:hypothetical protein